MGRLCHHLTLSFWLAATDLLDLVVSVEASEPTERPLMPEWILDGIMSIGFV